MRFEWKVHSPTALGSVSESFALVDAEGTVLPTTTVTLGVTVQEPAALATALPPTQTDAGIPAAVNQPEQPAVPTASHASDLTSRIIAFTDRFYLAFLFFLLLALGLNIFIKIRIQHAHVIGQMAIVIAIAATGLLLKFHFLQNLGQVVKVLGQ